MPPLDLKCTNTDCENDLHCFRESKKRSKFAPGACRECGATLVDWRRVHRRDLRDASHTFEALQHEWVRHQFWHIPVNQRAANYALRKGRIALRAAAEKRIRSAVRVKHSRDGRQTPWTRDILCYAQHGTACCCRRCVEYWHGIPRERTLSDDEIEYFTELCMRYVEARMPELPDQGQRISPIRKAIGSLSHD